MPFEVQLAPPPSAEVPQPVLRRGRVILEEIAATLEAMPAGESFWSAVTDTDLTVDVEGWRFIYRVDLPASKLVVRDIQRATARGG
jgi:hypothetical protein